MRQARMKQERREKEKEVWINNRLQEIDKKVLEDLEMEEVTCLPLSLHCLPLNLMFFRLTLTKTSRRERSEIASKRKKRRSREMKEFSD